MAGSLPANIVRPAEIADAPRSLVVINGEEWPEIVHGSVDLNGNNVIGSFRIDGILSSAGGITGNSTITDPIATGSRLQRLLEPTHTPLRNFVDVYVGLPTTAADRDRPPKEQLTKIMSGVLDRVTMSRAKDHVCLEGRDKLSLLRETYTFAQRRNESVSSIVKAIADNVGLQASIVESGTQAGTVYANEDIDIETPTAHSDSDFETLVRFANYDGYTVFVVDNTLYYQPIEEFTDTLEYVWGENIDELEMERYYTTLTGQVGVEVSSTQLKQKDSVVATAGNTDKQLGIVHRIVWPNATHEDALIVAQTAALVITQFARRVTIHTTGHPQQSLFNRLALGGTGTSFDGIYRIIQVAWTFGWDVGWRAEIVGLDLPDGNQLNLLRQRKRGKLLRPIRRGRL